MRLLTALFVVASTWLSMPTLVARARAAPAAPLPAVPLGRLVLIELTDGTRVKGRVTKITAHGVLLRQPDGNELDVPWEHIVRVALGRIPDPNRRRLDMPAAPSADATLRRRLPSRPWQPSSFYVEHLGIRVTVGGIIDHTTVVDDFYSSNEPPLMGGFEVTLFTLHWRYLYWEVFRGVVSWPFLGIGTSIGVPIRLTGDGRHELRLGGHLTLSFILGSSAAEILGASGAQVYYQYRMYKWFAFHIGLQQHSHPAALTLIFGVCM